MSEAFLSLGSNLGDKLGYINKAIEYLNLVPKLKVKKISSFYETKPWGIENNQENYINCCVKVSTNLNAFMLLGVCLGIECSLGRERLYKFSPRTIDIDIITYDNLEVNDSNLILPHPRAKERAFVLIPLREICNDKEINYFDIDENLKRCDKSGIYKLK